MDSIAKTAETRCPACNKPALPLEQNQAFPFCSHRCQLVDLGRWLDEDYRIGDDAFEGAAIPPAGEDRGSETSS